MKIINPNLQFKQLEFDNNPIMIVLHHADSQRCTIQNIHEWHLNNGWAGCGYHYFVRKDGTLYKGRPENATGSHCIGVNNSSIGICCEGNFNIDTMQNNQINSLCALIQDINKRYGIKQLYQHKELYNTDCAGKNFPIAVIKELIKNNRITEVINNMDIKTLQAWLNKNGFTDENGNVLVVDGVEGTHTKSAKAKAKNILQYILQ